MNDNILIGRRIRNARKNKKMSMKTLGLKVGLHESTVSRYEKGDIQALDVEKMKEFAEALDVTVSYLIGWEDDIKEKNTSDIMTIGNLFEYLRKQRNLSIEEFAEETGLTAESIRAYENGAGGIPAEIVKMLADFFDISVDKLVSGKVKGKDIFAAFASTNEAYVQQVTKWVEVFGNERFSDEEFEKIIEFAKFILSQRKN